MYLIIILAFIYFTGGEGFMVVASETIGANAPPPTTPTNVPGLAPPLVLPEPTAADG
jgi:hypothetical protein